MRKMIEEKMFELRLIEIRVTISIGMSYLTQRIASAEDLIFHADAALYKAKQLGRNKVCLMLKEAGKKK